MPQKKIIATSNRSGNNIRHWFFYDYSSLITCVVCVFAGAIGIMGNSVWRIFIGCTFTKDVPKTCHNEKPMHMQLN